MDIRPRLLRLAVLPAGAAALLGAGVSIFLWRTDTANRPVWATMLVIGTAVLFLAIAIGLAVHAALRIESTVGSRVNAVRRSAAETQHVLWQLLDYLQRNAPQEHRWPAPVPGDHSVPADAALRHLSQELHQTRQLVQAITAHAAQLATPAAGASAPADHHTVMTQRVGIFVNLARRLQSLVHREIELLDELESQVEDPELLKGLFAVDHLSTRIRRHAENLAVLGGAKPRRQWSRPVNVYEALRSAVAEVEQYSRVKLVRPIEGTLKGHAVADVIHLVAELVENAASFSAPQTQVLIRVQRVRAGLAIEVEDRGLGMETPERERYNRMLSAPDTIDLDELLSDGRIGLYVVSALARRHDLTVQLQSNIFGGTQAIMVIGEELLGDDGPEPDAVPAAVPSPPRETAPLPSLELGPNAADPGRYQQPRMQPSAGNGRDLPGAAQPRVVHGLPTRPMPSPDPVQPLAPDPSGYVSAPAATSQDERPALPKRNKQTHLAPQLRDFPQPTQRSSESGHDPNLMKAFQQGRHEADLNHDDPQRPNPGGSLSPYSNKEA